MTTVADVLSECRNDYLMSGSREGRNTLASSVSSGVTTFTFTYDLGGIDTGAKVSVGLEDCYVWAVTTTSKTATVSRGDFGSTAAAHSSGDVVTVNSLFTDAEILRAVNHELQSLSSRLYQVKTVDLTYNASVDGYDLSGVTDVTAIIAVRYQAVGSEAEWPTLDKSLWDHGRDLPTATFPSGQALFVRGYVDPGRTIRVTYRAPYTTLAATTDNVLTVSGLHTEAHDILALGAAVRLTAGREIRRNFTETQGDTRRAQEVPAGATLGANRGLMQLRNQRIGEESARLMAKYPPRLR